VLLFQRSSTLWPDIPVLEHAAFIVSRTLSNSIANGIITETKSSSTGFLGTLNTDGEKVITSFTSSISVEVEINPSITLQRVTLPVFLSFSTVTLCDLRS
jgi:hypothetical protein